MVENDEIDEAIVSDICTSVNALVGNHTFKIMRVKRLVKSKVMRILIDFGSTHNFVNLQFAKKLGCSLEKIRHYSC